jgi:3-dehydroquinate synthase
MKKMTIAIEPRTKYVEINLSSGSLFDPKLANELKDQSLRFALFCDDTVADLLGKKWQAHLEKLGLDVTLFTFPPGEGEKSRERKAALEDLLLSQKFGVDSCMIALGGGVTTDLIGYLASTYCRGVSLIHVPTTLLGMVDAAIGGKTGVNTAFGKNLIGTFYPADRILIDPATLASLPPSEWVSGSAEVIKYGFIASSHLFKKLQNWNPKDPEYLEEIIHQCVQIKAQVIEADFEEKLGLRRILNFGHTIAHALELLENYHMAHGEAVAIGMLVEGFLSLKMGYLQASAFQEMEKLIRSFPFALKISSHITAQQLREALLLDKKSAQGVPRFVLLEQIGACCSFHGHYCSHIPEQVLELAIQWMLDQFSGDS